nr:methyltransferase domain-containing protein [Cytophagales bacterium]
MTVHYDIVIEMLTDQIPENALRDAVFLDFGCGAGSIVERANIKGLNFHGADPYPKNRSDHYKKEIDQKAYIKDKIHIIKNDVLPFPDNYFDGICSNMVFEHIPDIIKPMQEIKRVLKPGGKFLALFPTSETAWEGHVNLYFAHWFKPHSKLGWYYLKYAKKFGFGNRSKENLSADEWAHKYQEYLYEYCFYRSTHEIYRIWDKIFQKEPKSLAGIYMKKRLGKHPKFSKIRSIYQNKIAEMILGQLYHVLGSRVLLVTKDQATS